MALKKQDWKNYTIEFLSVFIAVISAFALNNWNDNRRDNNAEEKILAEILNGLEKDAEDVNVNIDGHKQGIKACQYWRNIVMDQEVKKDSLTRYYFMITRDLISIQNTSGYETLKSRGFELIKNDSLRSDIISLYEYDYQMLRKLEEEYPESQLHASYYENFNKSIAPNFEFDEEGNLIDIKLPLEITTADHKILLSNLWRIEVNRRFILAIYEQVQQNIDNLVTRINSELDN
ncbi:hypothetical protein [Mangrovivirga cuniculi]|uniref:Uncharacterized protein n=1 Tax=Mangrovivirga cuniculi TaxID=2715131 RepID=A0A4D7JSP8_9BACT|nr:hypothetical protein [Mangrovivirga cuniculi]QCK16520.1 hypothetical protein DCC35_18175 [Mangrovivirga cuniculi]